MTSIRTFRSKSSLLISYFDVIDVMAVFSGAKFSLKSESVRTKTWKTIKLSVFNGKLLVSFTEKSADNSSSIQKFDPHYAGIVLRFIHPKVKPLIEDFLDEHFDPPEIAKFTPNEREFLTEVRFYDRHVKDAAKEDIAFLVLKMSSLAFPVYHNFIGNRISDGFYDNFSFTQTRQPYFFAKTYRDFLVSIFGTYRKDLAKVALKCNPLALDWAYQFKGLLPVDYIINGLRENPYMTEGIQGNLNPIRNFPSSVLPKLFIDGLTNKEIDFILIKDAVDMAHSIPVEERKLCKTWKELHDRGVMHYIHDEDGYKEISHPPEFEEFFAGANFGSRKVTPLRNSEDFIKTGKYMDVCVGSLSYITQAFDGNGYCFRVDNDLKEKYALIEVIHTQKNTWKINQVRGTSNATLPDEFHREVFEQLSKYIPLESRR